jgi:hypothetical protein
MATVSFTSSAVVVSKATGAITDPAVGSLVYTPMGFAVKITAAGLTASKATTFGGTQLALTFPLAKGHARELALAILQLAH